MTGLLVLKGSMADIVLACAVAESRRWATIFARHCLTVATLTERVHS